MIRSNKASVGWSRFLSWHHQWMCVASCYYSFNPKSCLEIATLFIPRGYNSNVPYHFHFPEEISKATRIAMDRAGEGNSSYCPRGYFLCDSIVIVISPVWLSDQSTFRYVATTVTTCRPIVQTSFRLSSLVLWVCFTCSPSSTPCPEQLGTYLFHVS